MWIKSTVLLSILFRGWIPTLIGYCVQGAFKFGLYEYFKYKLAATLPRALVEENGVLVFLTASASAEFFADIALAPWETVKVRIQTSRRHLHMRHVVPRLWATSGASGFFQCLVPLWCRQIPYTMVKFATFEQTAKFLAESVLHVSHSGPRGSISTLLIAHLSGLVAGTLCALVSQPADVIVSKMSTNSGSSFWQVVRQVGARGLFSGVSARIVMVGTLTGVQWVIYDGFKMLLGMPDGGIH
jgi:solute carrier family 25 phosphate transporter 3